jgi:hypothetical protein
MGTDIRWCVEVQGEDGVWEGFEPEDPEPQIRDFYKPEKTESRAWFEAHSIWLNKNPWYYEGRNYALFGVLAGVRSHTYPQISPLKGFPEDVSESVRDEMGYYEPVSNPFGILENLENDYTLLGGSHTWYTLQELLDYDWNATQGLDYFVNRTLEGLKDLAPWQVLNPKGEEEQRLFTQRATDPEARERYLLLTKRRGAQKVYSRVRIVISFG